MPGEMRIVPDGATIAGDEPQRVGGHVVSVDEVPTAVRLYFRALNDQDFDLLHDLWTPDAELHAVGSRPRHGRGEVMDYFRSLFAPWAEHRDTPVRVLLAQSTVVAEVRFTGVSRSGRHLSFDAVDVFDLTGNAITKLTTWYDLMWVRKQL